MKKTIIAAIAATLAGLSSISVCAKESAWEGEVGGARMALSFPFEGVCRVRYTKRGEFAAEANGTGVCVERGKCAACVVSETENAVRASTSALAVTLDKATGRVVFAEATTGRVLLFSLYHVRGIYENQRAATDAKRVVNLTRSSYAGQQRYATITWNGDTSANWASFKKQIPEGLAFMAAGCPYWTVDAGGFFTKTKQNLWFWRGAFPDGAKSEAYREYYVRMIEWAAFLPMMRSHGTDTPRAIWNFGARGEPYFDAIEKTIGERYELLPYTYSLAAKVTREGYTMARLLAFDFPDDAAVRNMGDEYMFGPSLLVCPVTDPGCTTRRVYLPKGTAWFDFRTRRREKGGRWIDAAAPLDAIPVFAKAGSIIPTIPKMQHTGEVANPVTTLTVYPGADGAFTLYDDAGDGYQYEKGEFSEIPLKWDDAKKTLTIGARRGAYPGMPETRRFRAVLPDGAAMSADYAGAETTVRF